MKGPLRESVHGAVGGLAGGFVASLLVLWPAAGLAEGIVEPDTAPLAPIDREAFRQQYGQEGLFRLRLGVDAAERSAGAAPLPCPSAAWNGSSQKQRYDTALSRKQYNLAGQALGEWRRLCPTGLTH